MKIYFRWKRRQHIWLCTHKYTFTHVQLHPVLKMTTEVAIKSVFLQVRRAKTWKHENTGMHRGVKSNFYGSDPCLLQMLGTQPCVKTSSNSLTNRSNICFWQILQSYCSTLLHFFQLCVIYCIKAGLFMIIRPYFEEISVH